MIILKILNLRYKLPEPCILYLSKVDLFIKRDVLLPTFTHICNIMCETDKVYQTGLFIPVMDLL